MLTILNDVICLQKPLPRLRSDCISLDKTRLHSTYDFDLGTRTSAANLSGSNSNNCWRSWISKVNFSHKFKNNIINLSSECNNIIFLLPWPQVPISFEAYRRHLAHHLPCYVRSFQPNLLVHLPFP